MIIMKDLQRARLWNILIFVSIHFSKILKSVYFIIMFEANYYLWFYFTVPIVKEQNRHNMVSSSPTPIAGGGPAGD